MLKSTGQGTGPRPPTTIRRVTIVGSGVIGTSVGLALRRAGIHVGLADRDADAVAGAIQMGAGVALRPADPPADVVVIATPPSTVAGVLRDVQDRRLGAVYTDVASTKVRILAAAEQAGCDLRTYIPGHPLAGHELSGPWAARADLFAGRPWVLCAHPAARLQPLLAVTELIAECGAELRLLTPDAHDVVVAAVSHAPHVVSAALAARFAAADDTMLSLVGKGLQDTTRIAAGAPGLWRDILEHNAEAVAAVLEAVGRDLAAAASALRDSDLDRRGVIVDLLTRGNLGRRKLAGGSTESTIDTAAA